MAVAPLRLRRTSANQPRGSVPPRELPEPIRWPARGTSVFGWEATRQSGRYRCLHRRRSRQPGIARCQSGSHRPRRFLQSQRRCSHQHLFHARAPSEPGVPLHPSGRSVHSGRPVRARRPVHALSSGRPLAAAKSREASESDQPACSLRSVGSSQLGPLGALEVSQQQRPVLHLRRRHRVLLQLLRADAPGGQPDRGVPGAAHSHDQCDDRDDQGGCRAGDVWPVYRPAWPSTRFDPFRLDAAMG